MAQEPHADHVSPLAGDVGESLSWHRAFIEAHPDGIVVLDPDTARPVYFNDQAARQLGYTREEFSGLSVSDVDAADSPEEIRSRIGRVSREGKADFDTVHRTKQGERRHVHVTVQLVPIAGRTLHYSIWRDITERKRVEAALRQSEERLARAQRSAGAGVWDWDIGTGGLTWSPELFDLLGLDRLAGPASFDLWRSVIHPDDLLLAEERIDDAVRQGTPLASEYRIVRPGGEVRWIAALGDTVYGPGGEPLAMAGICLDITHRRQADEQLEVLRQSVEQAPAPAYWLASDGRFTYANDAGCRALGYSRAELLRMTVFDVNPRATAERWAEVWRALRTRGVITTESEHRRKDGSTFPVALTSIYSSHGGHECCTGFAIDVSEERRLKRDRELLEAQLREAQRLESIGRLAGGVAHDFNNMLSVIIGHAELALRNADPAAPVYDDLSEIREAARRSAELTRQLLGFARRQVVVPQVLDLNDVIGGLLAMLRRLIGENIRLEWAPGGGVWPVRVDPSQVSQLLTNLVANARDAIPGAGSIVVSTRNETIDPVEATRRPNRAPGDYTVLVIQDDGVGMAADVVPHVFEPFFTTKAVGEGTGLGLATVYGIVQQNHGFIDVTSRPGAGTTFRIGLPRCDGPVAAASQPPAAYAASGHETLLLVEDEPSILRLCRRMLGGLGYNVLAAATPREALEIAERYEGDIDLLIADVVMPDMNGCELAERLASRRPAIRRLFMSGYPADVIAHHGVVEEGARFLHKPFTVEALAGQVREALDR